MPTIDLSADLGEGEDTDAELLGLVTSASVACGAHAGSPERMRATVRAARDVGVAVGAHPGYPDREGFGRRELGAEPADIERWVVEQIEALRRICREEGVRLRYVKAHGALYHRAARDAAAAAALAASVARVDRMLVVLALPGSLMLEAARSAGLATAREAFLDRGYRSDGTLAPRDAPGGMVSGAVEVAARALALARGEAILAADGSPLRVEADSLCVHGDSPDAPRLARAARARLLDGGFTLAPFAP